MIKLKYDIFNPLFRLSEDEILVEKPIDFMNVVCPNLVLLQEAGGHIRNISSGTKLELKVQSNNGDKYVFRILNEELENILVRMERTNENKWLMYDSYDNKYLIKDIN